MLSCTYMYRINKQNQKLAVFLQQREQIFHTQDLAVLWKITNKNTLYTTIKRYVQNGTFYRIFKGLYSTIPIKKLDPPKLGIKIIHGFAYISCETVLQRYGLINSLITKITLVSSKSKEFSAGANFFRSRKLHDKFLYNPCGIMNENGIQVASKERAVADMLYFNPQYHFDGRVNWDEVKKVQETVLYPLTPLRYARAQVQ